MRKQKGGTMNTKSTAIGAQPQNLELTISRVLPVPRELAFSAWTEPHHLERWQNAPKGFTVTTHEIDFRVGGFYRICMRSPEGVDHWLQGEYREIARPERIVM